MTKSDQKKIQPLIYSCSGCSNVAQLANDIALKANADGIAEMSCIAGIGGKVKPLVKKAQSNRPIIAIDGCVLQCAKHCLKGINVEPTEHVILTDYDFKKKNDSKLQLEQELETYHLIAEKIKNIRH